jgi:hypothetical protein
VNITTKTVDMTSLTYEELARVIGALTAEKNRAYGSSFQDAGKILRVLYPHGVPVDSFDDMLALVRIIDKMFRIASGNDGFEGESAYRDITGYGLLGLMRKLTEAAARDADEPPSNKEPLPF